MKKKESSLKLLFFFFAIRLRLLYNNKNYMYRGEKIMGESIGRMMDTITEFLRQHLNIFNDCGSCGCFSLIIIIAVIISARKKDDQEDLDFDEKTF